MTLPIDPALWQELCALQARYPTCVVTLFKHGAVISKATVLVTLQASQCERSGTGSEGIRYGEVVDLTKM